MLTQLLVIAKNDIDQSATIIGYHHFLNNPYSICCIPSTACP